MLLVLNFDVGLVGGPYEVDTSLLDISGGCFEVDSAESVEGTDCVLCWICSGCLLH